MTRGFCLCGKIARRLKTRKTKGRDLLDSLGKLKRTQYCGELRAADADKDVVLMGWVHRRRDLGQLIFVDLRDRAGLVAGGVQQGAACRRRTPRRKSLRAEFVVAVEGRVAQRQKPNPEICHRRRSKCIATRLHMLNTAQDAAVSDRRRQ